MLNDSVRCFSLVLLENNPVTITYNDLPLYVRDALLDINVYHNQILSITAENAADEVEHYAVVLTIVINNILTDSDVDKFRSIFGTVEATVTNETTTLRFVITSSTVYIPTELTAGIKNDDIINNILDACLCERNIVNNSDITEFIADLIQNKNIDTSSKVYTWLTRNLKNYLLNDYPDISNYDEPMRDSDPDWLKKAISQGDKLDTINITDRFRSDMNDTIDYLNQSNITDLSRLSIPDALKKSSYWHAEFAKQSIVPTELGKFKVLYNLSDGFKIVQLLDATALDREGSIMGHCVGSYADRVENKKTIIYSLWDSNNNPHATIEIK